MAMRMVGYNCGGSIDSDGNYNDGGKIHIAKNKKGTFKAQATKADMSGPAFANKVLSAPEGEYSPALRKKANFAKNFAYKNEGGDVPRYDDDGMLTNGPYERNGPEFDTVPTMLTEGEFVVNAASAHKFAPIIEAINDWKVGEPVPKLPSVQHLNLGDTVQSGVSGIKDAVGKFNTAVPGKTQAATLRLLNNADARKNARKAAQSRTSAARLNGSIQSLGASFDNQVAQASAAGFTTDELPYYDGHRGVSGRFSSNQAPATNYRSQLQAIGQGEQEAANAERDYLNQVQDINNAETDQFATQQEASAEASKAANKSINTAAMAIQELNQGAGKVINFSASKVVNNIITAQSVVASRISGPQNFNASSFGSDEKERAPINYYGANSPEMKSYSRFLSYLGDLKVAARGLLKGQGAISEGESQVVYDTVANLATGSDGVAASLQSFIDKTASAANVPSVQVPYTSVGPFISDLTENQLSEKIIGKSLDIAGKVDDFKDAITDKTSNVVDAARDKVEIAKNKGKNLLNSGKKQEFNGWTQK